MNRMRDTRDYFIASFSSFIRKCVKIHECNNHFAFPSYSPIYTAILNIHSFFFPLVYKKIRELILKLWEVEQKNIFRQRNHVSPHFPIMAFNVLGQKFCHFFAAFGKNLLEVNCIRKIFASVKNLRK